MSVTETSTTTQVYSVFIRATPEQVWDAITKPGREKLHFINPVPIRLVHDRWIDKYTERQVTALVDLKNELEKDA